MVTSWDAPCGCRGVHIEDGTRCTGASFICDAHADAGMVDGGRDWSVFFADLRAWCIANPPEEAIDE